ncbi:MAG: ABC transporter ATP-binding protein, partial [Candidatus Eiseniibacteriota bacterium]
MDVSLGGHRVLDAVDLEVPVHDFLAVIGPNGGGKTTLLRVILGLLRPDRGRVRVLGRAPEAVRGRIAYVPQYAEFDREFPIRVVDVVRMGRLRRHRLMRPGCREDERVALEAMERVGIAGLAGRWVRRLSGGQLQRVLIARALAVRAELLVLDEPTASLDIQSADAFYGLLAELSRQMTVVLTSHDIGSVSTHVRDMACLNGRLFSHALGELTPARVAEIYGCP